MEKSKIKYKIALQLSFDISLSALLLWSPSRDSRTQVIPHGFDSPLISMPKYENS